MYDFDSGDLSLDFSNTKDWHKSQKPVENLNSFGDLLTWGKHAGLVDDDSIRQLQQQARVDPQKFNAKYQHAIQLREAIYRIFSSGYAKEPINEVDLATLNAEVRQANAQKQLLYKSERYELGWLPEADAFNRILWSVALAAVQLLTSPELSRVRVCEDDRGCGYLFVDHTKNHSRRWCSMESCGNRAKARRHYSRKQFG